MRFHLIAVAAEDGRAEVVLADQAHDQPAARRVVLTFPLSAALAGGFGEREDQILEEARAILAAAQNALSQG